MREIKKPKIYFNIHFYSVNNEQIMLEYTKIVYEDAGTYTYTCSADKIM
jgi:hypothetical protein